MINAAVFLYGGGRRRGMRLAGRQAEILFPFSVPPANCKKF